MDIHGLGFRVGKLHEVNASTQQHVAVGEGYEPDFNISFFMSLFSSRSLWQNQLVAQNLHQERKTGMKTKMIEQFNCIS